MQAAVALQAAWVVTPEEEEAEAERWGEEAAVPVVAHRGAMVAQVAEREETVGRAEAAAMQVVQVEMRAAGGWAAGRED